MKGASKITRTKNYHSNNEETPATTKVQHPDLMIILVEGVVLLARQATSVWSFGAKKDPATIVIVLKMQQLSWNFTSARS